MDASFQNNVSPTTADFPEDDLDPFVNLEDGIFTTEKDSPAPPPFLAASSGHKEIGSLSSVVGPLPVKGEVFKNVG